MKRLLQALSASALIVFTATSSIAATETGSSLSFSVTNLKNDKGKLVIAVFDSKEKFLKEPISELSLDIDEEGEVAGKFSDLKPGTYAIAAYHDKNDDGKLNRIIVVPAEDYGFSNDARNMFGPPSFKEASFEVGEQDTEVAFKIK
jgi:uncharacterized protein (DUF2141 family)